jgi:hypothetical protein
MYTALAITVGALPSDPGMVVDKRNERKLSTY